MNILPRDTVHNWQHHSEWARRRDAQGADHSIYRHAMVLDRNGAGVVDWHPLGTAMDDLRAWLGVVLPRVPRTHELAVWFRVCFDAFDTNNAARTEQRVVRSARAVNAIEQEITALVERPSDQEVGQTHWLDMFAVVRRSTGDVSLRTPAATDATDGGRGGGSSVPLRPTSRGRGRPAGSGSGSGSGGASAATFGSAKKKGKRRLEAAPSTSLVDAVARALLGVNIYPGECSTCGLSPSRGTCECVLLVFRRGQLMN